MRTKHNCPTCQKRIPFGIQRCVDCGQWIYWQGDKKDRHPVKRTSQPSFPQKASFLTDSPVLVDPDPNSAVFMNYPNKGHVVVTGCIGDWLHLEYEGWVHYSKLALFGKLSRVRVVDPTNQGILEVKILDQPKWGSKPEECGIQIGLVNVGDVVEVWETTIGWIRIHTGEGSWISTFWIDQNDQVKLK